MPPSPDQQPDDIDKEAAEFYKKDQEKMVDELQEALHIQGIVKQMVDYIKKGVVSVDMPLVDALQALEKRQLELAGADSEETDEEDEEDGEDGL